LARQDGRNAERDDITSSRSRRLIKRSIAIWRTYPPPKNAEAKLLPKRTRRALGGDGINDLFRK
jgi:hypothetical protein